jgi:hypothetical protein
VHHGRQLAFNKLLCYGFAMTTQGSIILAAMIIGGSILSAAFIDQYQLAMGGDSAWRINKRTGQVVACQIIYDPFKTARDFSNAPAKPQTKPMVVIECGDD